MAPIPNLLPVLSTRLPSLRWLFTVAGSLLQNASRLQRLIWRRQLWWESRPVGSLPVMFLKWQSSHWKAVSR